MVKGRGTIEIPRPFPLCHSINNDDEQHDNDDECQPDGSHEMHKAIHDIPLFLSG